MATLKEYFLNDFANAIRWNNGFKFIDASEKIEIEICVAQELYSKTIFIAYYIPYNKSIFKYIYEILSRPEAHLSEYYSSISINSRFISDIQLGNCSFKSSVFSRKVYLYLENDLNVDELTSVKNLANSHNLCVTIRSNNYTKKKMELEKPLAFISHDHRDKEKIAQPIALELKKLACHVWYDEYSLKVGDKLRESIEKGLKETKKCILILSQNFLQNEGWAKIEFDSIFTREAIENSSVILPVWVGVSKFDIYKYCPNLANRFALIWANENNEEVITKLYKALK